MLSNVHECRADKSRETSETTKFLREENDKLNKKIYELKSRKELSRAEKNTLEKELTVNREFFYYLVAS
jgi:phosphoribosyl-ATP pyrophosphohydrolase